MAEISDRVLRAFLVQMLRTGAVDQDDIVEAAERLDKLGDEDAAHAMRCIVVEANSRDPSDWKADQNRARFRVIDTEGYKPEG